MGKKKDNTLVKNASFLMVAALISKIIGLIYKSPLSNTMGKESFGCFQFAQNVYFILLMIASFSIPQAVSKIMAERLAFRRYRDAQRIFKGALLYAVVMGGAVAILCIVGAPVLVPDKMANARLALQFLAPTIFISGILGVFRGYFQAYRNMLPTSVSQIVEQIAVAVVALVMANVMVHHFAGADPDVLRSWSAAGATMGTGAGVTAALLFMLFVYKVNHKTIQRKIARDKVSVG
ncbi:MAG: oligosaccharide flippase family protein, partial [Blautia sp.]|nr:oligosaccharide flippase family protein [Blautia sp.]